MIVAIGQSNRVEGWFAYRCDQCGSVIDSPYGVERVTCGCAGAMTLHSLSREDIAELLPDESDPTLIGSRLEELFKAIGIPTCGGCEQRRDWMNAAHTWMRGLWPKAADEEAFNAAVRGICQQGPHTASALREASGTTAGLFICSLWLEALVKSGELAYVVIDGQKRYGLPAKSCTMS